MAAEAAEDQKNEAQKLCEAENGEKAEHETEEDEQAEEQTQRQR